MARFEPWPSCSRSKLLKNLFEPFQTRPPPLTAIFKESFLKFYPKFLSQNCPNFKTRVERFGLLLLEILLEGDWILSRFWWLKKTSFNDSYPLSSCFFKKWANLGLFFCLFSVFSNKNLNNFYNKYTYVKNVHRVYIAGIRTHNLWNMSLLP